MPPERNIKLELEYEGTNYAGWQRQKNARSIQQCLEEALAQILQEPVTVIGAGRTDAGVHALGQVMNFKTNSKLSLRNIVCGVNSLLPKDIVVIEAEEVAENFNARRSAKLRWYRYQILNRVAPPALHRYYYWHIPQPLQVELINQLAEQLRGTHDFRAFRSQLCTARRTVLTMESLTVQMVEQRLIIDFKCRSFLHNMVRIMVGLMVEVGKGKLPVSVCEEMLQSGRRKPTVPTAPPQGLILVKVFY